MLPGLRLTMFPLVANRTINSQILGY